ncbi:MAG: AraC family transcriptional regulator [Bacteroidota bacterium]
MKPIFEKIPFATQQLIKLKQVPEPEMSMPYHYHPELEICLTENREGKRFVGNRVEAFERIDLVFLGENLPHCFIGTPESASDSVVTVLQFRLQTLGEDFLKLPELHHWQELLRKSEQGLRIGGEAKHKIRAMLYEMLEASPFSRLLLLLQIMQLLSENTEYQLLSSERFTNQYHKLDYHRLNDVYNFIVQNLSGEIRLSEAAKVANLSETAFCRFFKQRTLKTFTEVVNEMRISYACDLIIKGKLNRITVQELGKMAGYPNTSNFNRQFKRITQMTPAQYAREFFEQALPQPSIG